MTGERSVRIGCFYICFVDCQKTYDSVKDDKLVEIMLNTGILEFERDLIIDLYWSQQATLRVDGESRRAFSIKRAVRQGCIISRVLFNLYSEFMISEPLDGIKAVLELQWGISPRGG